MKPKTQTFLVILALIFSIAAFVISIRPEITGHVTRDDIYYNDGYVGIGTDDPKYQLDVDGDSRFRDNLIVEENLGIGTDTPNADLHIKSGNASAGADRYTLLLERAFDSPRIGFVDTRLRDIGSAPAWAIDNYLDTFRIFREPNISSPGFAALVITNESKVGIGTHNPQVALHIMNTANDQQLRISDAGTAGTNQGRLEIGYDATNSYGRLQGWNDYSGALPIVLNPVGGNVSIGGERSDVSIGSLAGSGQGYVCVDSTGKLYRHNTDCA